jgi:hypothetical protein
VRSGAVQRGEDEPRRARLRVLVPVAEIGHEEVGAERGESQVHTAEPQRRQTDDEAGQAGDESADDDRGDEGQAAAHERDGPEPAEPEERRGAE